jgi:hypothetical protein
MKPISRELRDLIGKPSGKPEEKNVAEQPISNTNKLKLVCQNCKSYDRRSKICITSNKYVPRKGTCSTFVMVVK